MTEVSSGRGGQCQRNEPSEHVAGNGFDKLHVETTLLSYVDIG